MIIYNLYIIMFKEYIPMKVLDIRSLGFFTKIGENILSVSSLHMRTFYIAASELHKCCYARIF